MYGALQLRHDDHVASEAAEVRDHLLVLLTLEFGNKVVDYPLLSGHQVDFFR